MNRWAKIFAIALAIGFLTVAKAGPFSGGGSGDSYYMCFHNGEWFANVPASNPEQAQLKCDTRHQALSPDPNDHPPMMVDAPQRPDGFRVAAGIRDSNQSETFGARNDNHIVIHEPHCTVDGAPIDN